MSIKTILISAIVFLSLFHPPEALAEANNINYDINASFNPDEHTISGIVRITFNPPLPPLFLYPNIYPTKDKKISEKEYDRIYPKDFNAGHIKIISVTDAANNSLPFRIDGHKDTTLKIESGHGEPTEIIIAFKTVIPEKFGPFGYFKDIYTLAGGWHPYVVNPPTPPDNPPTSPFSKGGQRGILKGGKGGFISNYKITLTMPKEYNIALPHLWGEERGGIRERGNLKTISIEANDIHYFDMVISKKLVQTKIEKDGCTFSYFHLKKDKKYALAAIDVANDAADFFTKNLGEIKNKSITFAESYLHQDIVSPQENVILISNRFHKAYSYLRQFHNAQLVKGLYYKFWRDIIPKEEEDWVAEGLADYAMQRYIQYKYGQSPSLSGYLKPLAFIPLFDEILYSKKLPMRDIYFKEHNHLVVREDMRLFNNNRPDGSIIFQKLKNLAGEEKFDKIIETYRINLKEESKSFRKISEEITNQNLGSFYHQWLEINPTIDFGIKSVKKSKINENNPPFPPFSKGGKGGFSDKTYKTEITLEKDNNAVEPVDVKITYKDKTSDTYQWDGKEEEKKIDIESQKPADSVELDPEKVTSDPDRFNNRLPHRWKVLLDRFRISYDFQSHQVEFDLGASTTRIYDDHHFFVFNIFHKEEVDGANLEYGYNFGGYNGEDRPLHTISTKLIFEKLSESFAETAKGDEYINAIGLSYRYDTYRASVEYADKFINGDYSYFKGMLDLRKELRIANKHSIAGRTMIGQSEGTLPDHTKFLLGGINGMRGYTKSDYKGNNISLFSLEYRFPIIYDHDLNLLSLIIVHTAQGAVFADAGMVSDNRDTFRFKDYKTDVGAGLRFHVDLFGIYPGIGRIDFAIPVGETEKSRRVHVYLSIGQSF
ncbi:MAG: BamA/TamA family outer membrane protein [Nitrospirota bacterium]